MLRIKKKGNARKEPVKTKKVLTGIFMIVIIGGCTAGLSVYFYYNPLFFEEREPSRFYWLSAAFTSDSLQIIQDHGDEIDMLSPTWYSLADNGSIQNTQESTPATNESMHDVIGNCTSFNISIHPLVSSGNLTNVRYLLENPVAQQNFFDSVNQAFATYGFAGINIDFEGIPDDLRSEFTRFFQDLKVNMDESKLLSIDVPAKTWYSSGGWGGWCDYKEIGKIADMFMVMTYDYSGGWTGPGEVAPTSWVKKVLAFTTMVVPVTKVFVGIPRYGYDWSDDPSWPNWGYGYSYFEDKVNTYGGTPERTQDGKELKYEYTDSSGFNHVAYYCDAETTRLKERFLSRYPVGGYCYWHLSSGDPAEFDSS
ncbi:MAG: glycosyl hydrolase family 18 protein [Promethearchaeota archaeon]